jgi:hypothetical protein
MCGGTWPPNRGERITRTDNAILLDGADDLIDASPAFILYKKIIVHTQDTFRLAQYLQPNTPICKRSY